MLERLNFSEVGKAMLVTGLVLLVSAAALLFAAEAKLRHSNEEVRRITTALLLIDEVKELVIGVDYSARGYALAGLPLFLRHENEKQQRLKAAVAELSHSISPQQRQRIAELQAKAARHAAVYAALVAKGPHRLADITAVITDPVERKKRYDVLDCLADLKSFELQALELHQKNAEHQMRQTSILTVVIVAIAFLGGMTDVMGRIWRDRRRRRTLGRIAEA